MNELILPEILALPNLQDVDNNTTKSNSVTTNS